ncbi:MAG: apolipoprotein N-acyltransferase [Bryobacteraceae bacterium]|nr:apolipoprotein N-acyltransferase [Bryobacteraceae bacterium]
MLLNYALAVLSGLLMVLIHPRANFAFLAPFALAPLIYALAREWVPRHRFLLAYSSGLVFWATSNYWIHFVISVHGGLGTGLGVIGFVLFVLLRAVPMGLFGLSAGVVIQQPYALLAVPAMWVAMERIPYLYDYKWLMLGNAGIDMSIPMRLAPLTGVYGLSFLFAMLGVAIAFVVLRRGRRQLLPLLSLVILPVLPSLPEGSVPDRLAVSVQPSVADRDNWTAPEAVALTKQMEALSLTPLLKGGRRPSLILWPEIPAPLYYFDDPVFRESVTSMIRIAGVPTILGTVARNAQGEPLNSALVMAPSGEPVGRYDKMNLVPFGEYTPWPFRGFVDKISNEIGDFVPGKQLATFELVRGERAGVFICYESAFPDHVRTFVGQGATLLVNLSNDGYFGGSAAREQHLSLVRMRAAENDRWILRSTNDGITTAVDPAGRTAKPLPQYAVTSAQLPFAYRRQLTPYSRWGDVFAWSCVGASVVALGLSQIPQYKRG